MEDNLPDLAANKVFDTRSSPHQRNGAPIQGPTVWQWVLIVTVCVVGGYWLAFAIYKASVPTSIPATRCEADPPGAASAMHSGVLIGNTVAPVPPCLV